MTLLPLRAVSWMEIVQDEPRYKGGFLRTSPVQDSWVDSRLALTLYCWQYPRVAVWDFF